MSGQSKVTYPHRPRPAQDAAPEPTTKVVHVALQGGALGQVRSNPRTAIARAIEREAALGWQFVQALPSRDTNGLAQLFCLLATFGLWLPADGWLLIFEKR